MHGPEYVPTISQRDQPWEPHLPWLRIGCGIVLLSVIVAILFPLCASPKFYDHSLSDLSKMKMINTALIMYESDNDDHFPSAEHWMDGLYAYSKNEQILHSSAVPSRGSGHDILSSDPYGIAFRKSLATEDFNALVRPEEVAVVFDSTKLARNASGELDLLPDPPRHKGDNGGSRYNLIAFVDGHVKSVPKPVVVVR